MAVRVGRSAASNTNFRVVGDWNLVFQTWWKEGVDVSRIYCWEMKGLEDVYKL